MMDTMNLGKRIKNLRESKGLIQKELARKLGVSVQSITMWETGLRNPNANQRKKICEFFGITPADLFGGSAIEVKDVKIPVVSLAKASDEKGFEFENLEPYEYEYIDFKNCKAVKITSNSMAPIAYSGQKIIYCESATIEDGDLVFVKFKTGEQYFKRYFNDNDKKLVTLAGANNAEPHKPYIKKREEIEFMFKVVGVKF